MNVSLCGRCANACNGWPSKACKVRNEKLSCWYLRGRQDIQYSESAILLPEAAQVTHPTYGVGKCMSSSANRAHHLLSERASTTRTTPKNLACLKPSTRVSGGPLRPNIGLSAVRLQSMRGTVTMTGSCSHHRTVIVTARVAPTGRTPRWNCR